MNSGSQALWHVTLVRALEAARYRVDDLRLKAIAEFGDEPEWVAEAIAGTRQPAMHEYLMISSLVSLPVTVLSGVVELDESTGIALRAGTLANPAEATAKAQQRGAELVEARRLISSWFGADYASRASTLEQLRKVISYEKYPPIAGKNTAQQVRAMLGKIGLVDAGEPIGDLVSLVEALGVPVELSGSLPDDVHGVAVHDGSLGSWDVAIVLRVSDYWVRQRYTLAHELCHVLFRDSGLVSINDTKTEGSSAAEESRAEHFARHFLMPTTPARKVWLHHFNRSNQKRALCEFMLHFGVSREAATVFLCSEGLISASDQVMLRGGSVRSQMYEAGLGAVWDELTSEQHEPSASVWLLEAALELYRQRLVPASVVADVLGQSEIAVSEDLRRQGWSNFTDDPAF